MLLANGERAEELEHLAAGEATGTLFLADEECLIRALEAN